ncbi:hydrocephalus-inducing protein homolog [Octopus sinensis]|uniref:Hydrocephalus-inducing protein homolog n=1 Tax=Octopus sinensis TaxID=2607531 RepID=A0A6P7TY50_9MOLL|nr:hydrocephalus-inducing protein homolog [Octopus sinensis]
MLHFESEHIPSEHKKNFAPKNPTIKKPIENQRVPRLIRVTQVESPYFKIISPNDSNIKVGPGLPITFKILFTPEEHKIVLSNRTDIPASFSIDHSNSEISEKFSLYPISGEVAADGYQAVRINFSADKIMNFYQQFKVKINGVREKLDFNINGSVIGPTFQFDKKSINFGHVAFGFVTFVECTLSNTALIPMNFHLRIKKNGDVDPINCEIEDCFEKLEEREFDQSLKEFAVYPNCGQIMAKEKCKIKIRLLPNILKSYENGLIMDVDEIGENVYELPIFAT